MKKIKYVVSWYQPGFIGNSKIYKYRKSAFAFVYKLKSMFGSYTVVIVEKQERKGETWTMIGRWMY